MTRPRDLPALRFTDPDAVRSSLAARPRFAPPADPGARVLLLAADHPARGALGAGADPTAMGDRFELLRRLVVALGRPGVTGFVGTADLVEDLTLLGALDGKLVLGSMNRGGLAGASFELDDRFTGYDAAGIAAAGLDGGKMLLRLDLDDAGSLATLEASARAVDALAARDLVALVEPFLVGRGEGGLRTDLGTDAVVRSVAIASGLASTTRRTWLKVPLAADMERVASATTLPLLVLGGEVPEDLDATMESWRAALELPSVRGFVIGRSLLYPPGGDVAAAVDEVVGML
ncbi:conserved hypothetical protein [Beutenbergia cavernae DSM 12333]|uniref:Cgl0159-like domain-containing protein n=1 Tax=Beutenbergia cavernae (strain ATCC BAA-8 / DSM 12333 / CCUG 43141 / JCM 11478 / NBRC 16432 / NCIMB 13614 / HKI 0122) TaxID=471853 RepID=C5BYM9_BEUC1|nr:hypothetical protein [Beutenbergia cavernae]ACQ78987.1 conserved hypothetical protein [Beutenbergia cavernae DSM 12333]